MLVQSINTLIHMTSSVSDMKFLFLIDANCKTFTLNLFLKITFYKSKCYCLYILFICNLVKTFLQLHNSHQEFQSIYVSMAIESCLFCARVGIYNFNLRSFKQKPNRYITKSLFTIRINKPFKIPFFKLAFSLVFVFLKRFLKNIIYEKLGIFEMKKTSLFPTVCIFKFSKNINPRFSILFLVDKSMT